MTTFNFIHDDSHGWLEVNLNTFPEAKNYATGFGFINGNTIYLEEDVEAPNFIEYLKTQGKEFDIIDKTYDGQWFGRSYSRNVRGSHYNKDNQERN